MFRTLRIRMAIAFLPLLPLFLFQNCSPAKFSKAEKKDDVVVEKIDVDIELDSSTVLEGDPAVLAVRFVSGDLSVPYRFRWAKDGSVLSGQDLEVLRIERTALSDAGSYSVQILHNGVVLDEAQAFLEVTPKPDEPAPPPSPGKNSLRLNKPNSGHLTRTPAVAGDGRTWTFSAWVKRASLSGNRGDEIKAVIFSTDTPERFVLFFDSGPTDGNRLRFHGDQTRTDFKTKEKFTDTTVWLHIVLRIDTTQADEAERAKLYINGRQVTEFSEANYPDMNESFGVNQAINHCVGCRFENRANWFFDGLLSDVHIVEGLALDASHFGQTHAASGKWIPKAYTGSHGANGFHLDFNTKNGTVPFGMDASGNGNNLESYNLTPADAIAEGPGTGYP